MLKKTLLPAGIIAITQLGQGYTMDPQQKPQTREQSQENRDKHDAHSNWALKEGPLEPEPRGAYDARSIITGMGQNLRYGKFTCPTAEEFRSHIKEKVLPMDDAHYTTSFQIRTKQGIDMKMLFTDDPGPTNFNKLKNEIDSIPIVFQRAELVGGRIDTMEKPTEATDIYCMYQIPGIQFSSLAVVFRENNDFNGNKGFPNLKNGATSGKIGPFKAVFKSQTNNPEDIVFQLIKKEK